MAEGTQTPGVPTGAAATPEQLLEQWKGFDLNSKKHTLDGHAAAIADLREASAGSRKRLVKETTDFKKLPDDSAKLASINPLIKLYQEEIDTLSRRAKNAEAAFTAAYTTIVSLPDLAPALASAAEDKARLHRLPELEIDNKRLKEELAEFQKEFSELQNQQVTIRRLEGVIRESQQRAEEDARGRAEERAAIEAQLKEAQSLKDALAESQATLANSQQELTRLSRACQEGQAALLNMKATSEAQLTAKQSEIEILTAEMEKMRSSMMAAPSQQKQEQQKQNAAATDSELRVAQQGIEIERLSRQLGQLESSTATEKANLNATIAEIRRDLEKERAEKEALKASKPSEEEYTKVLSELETYKILSGSSANAQNISSTESALTEKNRKLESEAAKLRGVVADSEAELAQLRGEMSACKEEETRLRALVDRLEDQLSRSSAPSAQEEETIKLEGQDGLFPFSRKKTPTSPAADTALAASSGTLVDSPQGSSAAAVLEIVAGQRDRFKSKIVELETEKARLMEMLERAESDTRILKQDNLKLYERVKYLQSFDEVRSSSSSSQQRRTAAAAAAASSYEDIEGSALESRYGSLYEESINPFAAFSKKVKSQKFKDLSAADKVLLRSTSFFLENKYTRGGLFAYMALLHVLVFAALYKMSTSPC